VIGASTGIGAAVARDLINAGARVALSARSRGRLERSPRAPTRIVVPLDVTTGPPCSRGGKGAGCARGARPGIVLAGTHSPMRADQFDRAKADHCWR